MITLQDMDPSPQLAPEPDWHPCAARLSDFDLHGRVGRGYMQQPRVQLPPREHLARLPAVTRELHYLMRCVLQHDRVPRQVGQPPQNQPQAHAAQHQIRELPPGLIRTAQQLKLMTDDRAVNPLGDLDEADPLTQQHQRQAQPLRLVNQLRRHSAEPFAQPNQQARDPCICEAPNELPAKSAIGANAHESRQQQLAALQVIRDVRLLGNVHPAHRPVQKLGPGKDKGAGMLQDIKLKDLCHSERRMPHVPEGLILAVHRHHAARMPSTSRSAGPCSSVPAS